MTENLAKICIDCKAYLGQCQCDSKNRSNDNESKNNSNNSDSKNRSASIPNNNNRKDSRQNSKKYSLIRQTSYTCNTFICYTLCRFSCRH